MINNLEKCYNSREKVINFFRDYIEMLSDAKYDAKQNETKGTGLKILTPKQMLQRLPIALAQVKASNNSENLLNEIRQIVYSVYPSKQITKRVYNNISNTNIKMDPIFIKPVIIALSNFSIYYTWKNIKSSSNSNKFKISASTWSDKFESLNGSYSV